jgi:hypothetical protein
MLIPITEERINQAQRELYKTTDLVTDARTENLNGLDM